MARNEFTGWIVPEEFWPKEYDQEEVEMAEDSKTMCKICRSVKRPQSLTDFPTENPCFEHQGYIEEYRILPGKKSPVIKLTCRNFSHVRSCKINMQTDRIVELEREVDRLRKEIR